MDDVSQDLIITFDTFLWILTAGSVKLFKVDEEGYFEEFVVAENFYGWTILLEVALSALVEAVVG